jgi:CRP-like cAMP-binding protein
MLPNKVLWIRRNKKKMSKCLSCKTYNNCIASVLKKEELVEFEKKITSKILKRDKMIFREEHSAKEIFILLEGRVKLEHLNASMSPVILRIAQIGELLGLETIFLQHNYFMTALSLTDVECCVIPKSYIDKIVKTNHAVCLRILLEMQHVQERTYKHALVMISGSSEAKLAQAILSLCNHEGKVIITKEKIALMTGLTRETVSRILSRMNSKKMIETLHRSVNILKRDELLKLTIGTKERRI